MRDCADVKFKYFALNKNYCMVALTKLRTICFIISYFARSQIDALAISEESREKIGAAVQKTSQVVGMFMIILSLK